MWFKRFKLFIQKEDLTDFFYMIKLFYQSNRQIDKFPDFENYSTIATINTAYQNYFTTKGKVVKSIHPPDTNLVVKIGEEEVIATPFRKDDNIK